MSLQFLLILLVFRHNLVHSDDKPVVSTPLGIARGYHKTSFSNKTYSAFEGIPYAQPPIGHRRFEKPESIEKWDGIWNANSLHECPQVLDKFQGDEDCLYINVYVPRAHINSSESLDVIAHIHGGAFVLGSGDMYAFPGFLMDHNVIFVTFNYRIGILGFLSTEDDILPGNNGFKDQVQALKWIQQNIASFGGNRKTVTLTGASAGATSVHLHFLSPMSHGLFAKGFSQSGSALNTWVLQKQAVNKAKMLGVRMGCPQEPTEILVRCLKQRHVREIVKQTQFLYSARRFPLVPLGAVVEGGKEPFLAQEPYKLLVQKQVKDLPWMASVVQDEAGDMFYDLKEKPIELNTFWKKFHPIIMDYNFTAPPTRWNTIEEKIREFYVGSKMEVSDKYEAFVESLTDRVMVDGIARSVRLQSEATNASVYFYKLAYTGDSKKYIGHGDDNQYFYWNGSKVSSSDLKIKDVMMELLLSYARNSKPVLHGFQCDPVETSKFTVVAIYNHTTIAVENATNLGNAEFWDSLDLEENQSK